ncbi:Gamma-glutamylputrescine oxidoreductase [Sinobacterium norvegicum]|uniref:Gamma-glutamylputrescine oxidoreductase n=1 Tax=Sinobacterium norvegicum TaxID=1641715 RepID=A0ABM9AHI7_9GAMM|nr:FAD-binding oxidoreductase [Sinobacterium norvegicum]CAH0992686.1 Gamma-glutamylputrescine oxidoreductase [Sinobacterium norvegicum]
MSTIQHTGSYYADSANNKTPYPQLDGSIDADVCVIGGGYSGLSSALHLQEQGFNVVLLEAGRIGWGASGRNGGQLINSYSRDIDHIRSRFGSEAGDMLGSMAFEGNAIIRQRIKQYTIDCDLKDGSFFAANTTKQLQGFEQTKALWEGIGHQQLSMVSAEEVGNIVNTDRYCGGLLDMSGGHIHPLNLALGEAEAFVALGGQIFEQSEVIDVVRSPLQIKTAHGEVNSKYAVVAGNAYLGGLIPELASKTMPCGTQIVATEPLTDEQAKALIPSDYCVEDGDYLLDYFRLSADNRLIYGGGVNYGGGDPSDIQRKILPKLKKTFPQLGDIKIDYSWGGDFLLTLSRLPQLGRLNNNIYYCQGYSGHGVTTTHLAGKLIAEALSGDAKRFDAFANLPHYPFPGGRLLRTPLTAAAATYYSLRDRLGI